MTKKTLKQIQEKILADKKNIEEELARFADKNIHNEDDYQARFPEYGDDEEENASEISDFSSNLALERHLEKMLKDIKNALASIEKGTYGKCKYCKQEINEKRLLARPTSSSCMACKIKLTGIK